MTNRNRPQILLALAAALILSGCDAAGEKAAEQAVVNNAEAAASPGVNAASPAPVADGGVNVVAANAAAPASPATGGQVARPGAAQNANARGASSPAPADAPKPRIGSGGNDFYLFTKARGALSADAELKTANVIVEVKEGVGTLSGTVASEAQKSKAEQLARAAGFKSVKNQLRVSAGK